LPKSAARVAPSKPLRKESSDKLSTLAIHQEDSCWPSKHSRPSSVLSGRRVKFGAKTGRRGLPAESVLRCTLLKQQRQLSYEELAFHLEDSASFRAFARLPLGWSPGEGEFATDSCWKEMDSNHWFRHGESCRGFRADRTVEGVGRAVDNAGGSRRLAADPRPETWRGTDPERDVKFESSFLQRGVSDELAFGGKGSGMLAEPIVGIV
jgi:hypothetical protein